MEFFELIYQSRELLSDRARRILFISNSGFPEPKVNWYAIECCQLFTKEMGFQYMGGFGVSPGTLIDGKELAKAGGTYKRLIKLLNIIAEQIAANDIIPTDAYKLVSKPFMSPKPYRFFGNMIQKNTIKQLGKDKFYAKPLLNRE